MSTAAERQHTVLAITAVVVLLVGWWWHGQSSRQPKDTPIRQESDIRSTTQSDQQAARDAINALGSGGSN